MNIILADTYPIYRAAFRWILRQSGLQYALAQCSDAITLKLTLSEAERGVYLIVGSSVLSNADFGWLIPELARLKVRSLAICECAESDINYRLADFTAIVHRDITPQVLTKIIKAMVAGERSLGDRCSSTAASEMEAVERMGFTKTELKIMHYVGMGMKNKDIASRMKQSEQVAKNHLGRI